MNPKQVAGYFKILSNEFKHPCRIILTGAAAGGILGHVRGTLDIDFAIRFSGRLGSGKEEIWERFRKAAEKTSVRIGIAVQYSEDIERWSMITYLDYENHSRRFGRFGSISVYVLEPAYWAIGKLARYLDQDIRDLISVLTRQHVSWRKLAALTGLALKKSPKSDSCFLFKRQVEDFFKNYGKAVWGKPFRSEKAMKTFHKSAGIK